MNDSTEPVPVEKTNSVDNAKSNAGWTIQLGVLCAMLLLALFGMGLSQASEKGAREY